MNIDNINYLLVAFVVLLLVCALRGAQKGMIRIVFGLVAWAFLVCFVNYGSVIVSDYITTKTQIPKMVEENIDKRLHDRYQVSEENEAGTGEEAVLSIVPERIKNEITDTIRTSIDSVILFVAQELTESAIKGLSTIITIVAGSLIIGIIDRLLRAVGFVPGIKDVNKTLGFVAGAFQGLVITWFVMYLATCFPYAKWANFIVENTKTNKVLTFVFENNIIEKIIRI
ncbi:MAG: CvpA family protein [Pseudobutyrivibrio sp.]|nr:CvpA family protein [Pseudobutyrivibrio sp.]